MAWPRWPGGWATTAWLQLDVGRGRATAARRGVAAAARRRRRRRRQRRGAAAPSAVGRGWTVQLLRRERGARLLPSIGWVGAGLSARWGGLPGYGQGYGSCATAQFELLSILSSGYRTHRIQVARFSVCCRSVSAYLIVERWCVAELVGSGRLSGCARWGMGVAWRAGVQAAGRRNGYGRYDWGMR